MFDVPPLAEPVDDAEPATVLVALASASGDRVTRAGIANGNHDGVHLYVHCQSDWRLAVDDGVRHQLADHEDCVIVPVVNATCGENLAGKRPGNVYVAGFADEPEDSRFAGGQSSGEALPARIR